jgi:DNA-binding response OmpR family regulator
MKRILIVEDEGGVRETLSDNLDYEGYRVTAVADLGSAREVKNQGFDLVILDVNLPDGDGISELKSWREKGFRVPILVCTVKDREIDVVRALDAGADDYVTKPFRIRELLSRIRAILRRGAGEEKAPICLGSCRVDFTAGQVDCAGELIRLTATEWTLLEFLYRNKNQVVSRDQIVEHVWGIKELEDSRAVDVHLGRLRRKLREPDPPTAVVTVRGLGYKLVVP